MSKQIKTWRERYENCEPDSWDEGQKMKVECRDAEITDLRARVAELVAALSRRPAAAAETKPDVADLETLLAKLHSHWGDCLWVDAGELMALEQIIEQSKGAAAAEANLDDFIAEIEAQPRGKEEVAAARQWAREYIASEVAAEQPAAEPELLPLPEWTKRDDLGGLVPSEIRTAMKDHARAHLRAAEQGKDSERLLAWMRAKWKKGDQPNVATIINAKGTEVLQWMDDVDAYFDAAMKAVAQGGGKW